MSTVLYGLLTKEREANNGTLPSSGVGSFVDALAALVPAEVLLAHAIIVAVATETKTVAGESVTTITEPGVLFYSFFALSVLSLGLFLATKLTKPRKIGWRNLVRAFFPALAFVMWAMLQRATAFDAVAPEMGGAARTAIAVVGAISLLALAKIFTPGTEPPSG